MEEILLYENRYSRRGGGKERREIDRPAVLLE